MVSTRALLQDGAAGALGVAGGEAAGALEAQNVPIALSGVALAQAMVPLDLASDIFLAPPDVPAKGSIVGTKIVWQHAIIGGQTAVTPFDPAAQLVWSFDPGAQVNSQWLGDSGVGDFISAQSLFGGGGAWGGMDWYPGMPVTFCFASFCTDWGSTSAHPGPAGQ